MATNRLLLTVGSAAAVAVVTAAALVLTREPEAKTPTIPLAAVPQQAVAERPSTSYVRVANPDRTMVRDETGAVVAVFTDGARTALINGPKRTFAEPKATTATLDTVAWVRLLPSEWKHGAEREAWFEPWFAKIRSDTSPDVLAIASEYLIDAPDKVDADGVRFQGDASFGPIAASGAGRLEQSDFYDYLGLQWTFSDAGVETAEPSRYGSVDCSGFVRLVYGYRMGHPLRGTNDPGPGLPRRAYAIADVGPGVQLIKNSYERVTDYGILQPGDLVFFEVEDGPEILDHVGIYLGVDSDGHHRFISSRERINGPTMGDVGGTSLLDDGGMYSNAWRAARRL